MGNSLTFLGTGTSTGVPMIRCHCVTCSSTDQRDKRLRCSALARVDGVNILIDCGPDLRAQILGNDIENLDAVVITHSHYDHVGGIDDLRAFCYPDGFDVYCKADVDRDLHAHFPYCFASKPYPGAPVLHVHPIEPLRPFHVKGIELIPLPVNHYLMEIVGFRIGDFAYITDAKSIPDETIEALRGVRTLVVNALRLEEHISHMNLSQALDVIKLVNPRKAYLTHLSHDMGRHADATAKLPPNVEIAYDGLTIDI